MCLRDTKIVIVIKIKGAPVLKVHLLNFDFFPKTRRLLAHLRREVSWLYQRAHLPGRS